MSNCIHYRHDFTNKSVHNFKTHNMAQANLIIKALKIEDSSYIVEAKECFNTLQSLVKDSKDDSIDILLNIVEWAVE
jgi:hypothetical protein